jgi:hypothetical protein
MLVFISWSGPKSKYIAETLENWLSQVIQAVEPWISQDIDKGSRWSAEIANRLEGSKVGIICLTKSNLDSKWIHYEAGALSKTNDAYVCTLLLDVKPIDVEQPLAQFQHTTTEKGQVFKLLKTINRLVGKSDERALPESRLREIFEVNWPRLEEAFKESASIQESVTSPTRSDSEVLQEVLEILRNQERRQTNSMLLEKNLSDLNSLLRKLKADEELKPYKAKLSKLVSGDEHLLYVLLEAFAGPVGVLRDEGTTLRAVFQDEEGKQIGRIEKILDRAGYRTELDSDEEHGLWEINVIAADRVKLKIDWDLASQAEFKKAVEIYKGF